MSWGGKTRLEKLGREKIGREKSVGLANAQNKNSRRRKVMLLGDQEKNTLAC
jgi:hypothetical protein